MFVMLAQNQVDLYTVYVALVVSLLSTDYEASRSNCVFDTSSLNLTPDLLCTRHSTVIMTGTFAAYHDHVTPRQR
jgi:hypothetical protein